MLTLNRRACWLGRDYSGKVADEGGQTIRTLVIELDRIMLDQRELNSLLGNPHAWDALYTDTPEGPVPFLDCIKSLEFDKPINAADLKLMYGIDSELSFALVELSKIKLSLQTGGQTAMSCKVRTAPTLDETLAQLFEHFGYPVECELMLVPPSVQKDLPLNTHGTGEQPADVAAAKAAAARKKTGRTRGGKGKGRGRAGASLQ